MNYCKDCLHFNAVLAVCEASGDRTTLVYGVKLDGFASAKEMRYSEAYCGSEGKWFDKREEKK